MPNAFTFLFESLALFAFELKELLFIACYCFGNELASGIMSFPSIG